MRANRQFETSNRKALIFSVALNGYQWRYRSLLTNHKAYAEKHSHRYVAVTQPGCSLLGLEVAWLKIRLIIEALEAGYDSVVFLDADTRISPLAPDIIKELEDSKCRGKDMFAAKGYSGRYNSGVLLIRNTLASQKFFSTLLQIATLPIPLEDQVGWGENGHLIYLAKHCKEFAELDPRWNNNHCPEMPDFVRHYSRGPLHKEFSPPPVDRALERAIHYGLAVAKRMQKMKDYLTPKAVQGYAFHSRIEALHHQVCRAYPSFSTLA